jgi:hypothetical protein
VGVFVPSILESDIAFGLLNEQNRIKPSPKTAVPSVITATRFERLVREKERSGFFSISRQV